MGFGLSTDHLNNNYKIIIKIAIPIARIKNVFLLKKGEDLFLNEEEPHLEQTILPPNDRSETNAELPQLKQTLFTLI